MSDADSTVTAAPPLSDEAAPAEPLQEPKKPAAFTTFCIWPPSQRTRDAVVSRLIETLATPSVLSKRYGTLPQEEADAAARRIEEEAFAVAGAAVVSPEEDGLGILQLYSKDISKRMLDTVKVRAAEAENNGGPAHAEAAGEEVPSSVEIGA